MAQRADTTDQPAIERGPLGRWGTLRLVEPAGPPLLLEPPDPGLVWVAGMPDERASAELTMRDLLSTWRSAERRLEGMTDGDGASVIRAQVVALREAYQRLFAHIRPGLPTPLKAGRGPT